MKALQNIKVLDLSKLLPGNYCGMLLADYGAQVVKVESPDAPDPIRSFQPHRQGLSYWHMTLNRGKKSLCLDLKEQAGREVFFALARQADVLLESSRPGALDRLGLGYQAMREVNPRLIYCSLSGYGQSGPYSHLATHDINIQGLAGFCWPAGEEGPVMGDVQFAGLNAAVTAAFAILAAINARTLTGHGQAVDISLLRSALSLLPVGFANYRGEQETGLPMYPRRTPNYCHYRTRDGGYFTVGALEPKFWRRLCELLGAPELAGRLDDREGHAGLAGRLAELFGQKTRQEWEEIFAGENICVTPAYNFRELMASGLLARHGMLLAEQDAQLGEYEQLNCPAVLSDTPGAPGSRARYLGEDSAAVLAEFGFTDSAIAELARSKIIANFAPG